METSTPLVKQKKKPGRPRKSDINVSPISTVNQEATSKSYSKRERKPRNWDDFETSDHDAKVPHVNTNRSGITNVKIVNNTRDADDNIEVIETGISDKSVGIKVVEKASDSLINDDTDVTRKVKKRGRPKKLKHNSDEAESNADIVEMKSVKMKKKSVLNNVDHCGTLNVKGHDKNTEDGSGLNESVERFVADPEELQVMQNAVESKRKTKYIEKVDRVMPKSNAQSIVDDNVKADTKNKVLDNEEDHDKDGSKGGKDEKTMNGNFKKVKMNANKKNLNKEKKADECSDFADQNDSKDLCHISDITESFQDDSEAEKSNTGDAINSFTMPPKKRGRPRKNPVASDVSCDFNSSENDSTCFLTPRPRGRPRKRKDVSYAETDEDSVTGSAMKKNRIDETDADTSLQGARSDKKKMTAADKAKSLQCRHCEYKGQGVTDIRRHCAIQHQVWWTIENPVGFSDRQGLSRVMEIRKFLNCQKCEKRLNFLQYYQKHVEWCGRENETYSCENCKKHNLKAQWKELHLRTCPALRQELDVASDTQSADDVSDSAKENVGKGSKRKAAKKAMSIVHNLSKSMDTIGDVDNSDNDPDAEIDKDEEDEDDHDIDVEIDEDSDGSGVDDENIDDVIDNDVTDTAKTSKADAGTDLRFNIVLDSYNITRKYMEENWCCDVFIDWLPWKHDWNILSDSDCKPYQVDDTSSVRFCFGRKEEPSSLKLFEGAILNGFPIFYTGLPIWRLAWCPMPLNCQDDPCLAVTGKLRHSNTFLSDKKYSGPGIIQVWSSGISSNQISKTGMVPRLSYTVAHDFGIPTEMKWCPSGCYRTKVDKDESSVYTRLGLLAVSFTDGTCRIFSLPHWSDSENKTPPTFKATPFLTLIPSIGFDKQELICSSMDWCLTKGHEKIISGYSNGSVKIFNLASESSLLKSSSEKYGTVLLPFRNILPHGDLVRSVHWCSTSDSLFITASEKFETLFWDLNNLGIPINRDEQCFMTIKSSSSVCLAGVFFSSDDNYTSQVNKGRYLECGSVMYHTKNQTRREECQTYYTSAQTACIWDINSSEWFPLVASCDNRGVILCSFLRDMMTHIADNKSYRFRNDLFRTHIIKNQTSQLPVSDKLNSSQSEMCQKCLNQLDTSSNVSESNNQSNALLHCTCDKIDQSKHPKKVLTNQDADITNECSGNGQEKASDRFKEMIKKGERKQKEESENCVLYFEENFRHQKKYRFDTVPDNYNVQSIAPIKSLQFNPNNSRCCWLAFGGDTGLVRLANVRQLLSSLDIIQIKQNESRR